MENLKTEDYLRLPGQGEKTASDMVIKARSEDMAGDFSVMEGTIFPHELLAPHTHDNEAQLVYIINGELEFEVGGKDGINFKAIAGSYVIKPRGIMHAFWNNTDEEVKYIELSGRDYFEGFVDSKKKGNLHAITHSKEHGMDTHMKDTIRLMKKHKLKGLSMMELPSLPQLPDWLKDLLPNKK